MVYSWIKKTHRAVFWGNRVLAVSIRGEKATADSFFKYYQHPDLGPQKRLCHFPMGLRLWGPWHDYANVNNKTWCFPLAGLPLSQWCALCKYIIYSIHYMYNMYYT